MKPRAGTPEETCTIGAHVGAWLSPDARSVVVVDASGRVRGGAAYDWWTQTGCFVHVWTDTPAAWRVLRSVGLEYPFLEGGRRVLMATVSAANSKSLRVVRHLGFQESARVRDGFAPGVDLFLFQLHRETWEASRKAA